VAEIVNLRQARKAKARSEAEKKADANRAKHGVAKGERKGAAHEREKNRQDLDRKRLDRDKE